jgi:hypothetical protein
LWNLRRRGSTVTTGDTATPRPNNFAVKSGSIGWAYLWLKSHDHKKIFNEKKENKNSNYKINRHNFYIRGKAGNKNHKNYNRIEARLENLKLY